MRYYAVLSANCISPENFPVGTFIVNSGVYDTTKKLENIDDFSRLRDYMFEGANKDFIKKLNIFKENTHITYIKEL